MRPCRPSVLAAAYAADLAFGDPPGFPHPVRLMGWVIARSQAILRPPRNAAFDFLAGAGLTVALVGASWRVAQRTSKNSFSEATLAWTTLATKDLLVEVCNVLADLTSGSLEQARRSLSRIVGRDTEQLSESEVSRATVETLGESLCDGVVAPLFYLSIGGVPAAMAYKAVNTLDSMIGHPEPPYTHFGRFAARADDIANWLPSRITALLIAVASTRNAKSALQTWWRDGSKHASPNAGQSEAAMAGALGVRLGGVNYYDGRASAKPFLGMEFRAAQPNDVRLALRLTGRVSVLAVLCALTYTVMRSRR